MTSINVYKHRHTISCVTFDDRVLVRFFAISQHWTVFITEHKAIQQCGKVVNKIFTLCIRRGPITTSYLNVRVLDSYDFNAYNVIFTTIPNLTSSIRSNK